MPTKVYWDTCIFMDWMKQDKPHRVPSIAQMVTGAESNQLLIVTSAWTLVELIRCDGGQIISASDEEKITRFLKNDYIEVRPLNRALAETATQIQRQSAARGMRMPKADSVHISTALSVKDLHALYTFDENDLVPHSGRWGEPPVKICLPPEPEKGLFPQPT